MSTWFPVQVLATTSFTRTVSDRSTRYTACRPIASSIARWGTRIALSRIKPSRRIRTNCPGTSSRS